MLDKLYLYRNDDMIGTLSFPGQLPNNEFIFEYGDSYFSTEHYPIDGISFNIDKETLLADQDKTLCR
jgi:hypothetical protein